MTNLQVLKASRRKPEPGDMFAMKVLDRFLFGRVILADLPRDRAPMPGSYLVYIYDVVQTDDSLPPSELLSPSDLLVPPLFINRLPWTKGYFKAIGHLDLLPKDRLSRHCFRDSRRRYVNEAGRVLTEPSDPCGAWGLHSYATLDDILSDALGIDRASE